jgi:hypothetical protein
MTCVYKRRFSLLSHAGYGEHRGCRKSPGNMINGIYLKYIDTGWSLRERSGFFERTSINNSIILSGKVFGMTQILNIFSIGSALLLNIHCRG